MKRVLVFESSEDGDRIYQALILALRFGRNQQQQPPGKDVLRRERDITRALHAVGEPDPVKSDDLRCPQCQRVVMTRDAKSYRLHRNGAGPAGATVTLTQADVELLQERIDKGPWTGDGAVDMADALDFLGKAPEPPQVEDRPWNQSKEPFVPAGTEK